MLHPSGLAIPFSVASAPERLPDFEIHFRPTPGAADAQAMQDLIARARLLHLEGPFGDVFVRGPTVSPLCLIAGGTGISQCLSIVGHLCACRQTERVRLLWSVSASAHLYAIEVLDGIRAHHGWFEPIAAVDEPDGQVGAIAALTRHGVPTEGEVILAGSPPFVYAVCDALDALGGYAGRLRSDVFAYAPR